MIKVPKIGSIAGRVVLFIGLRLPEGSWLERKLRNWIAGRRVLQIQAEFKHRLDLGIE